MSNKKAAQAPEKAQVGAEFAADLLSKPAPAELSPEERHAATLAFGAAFGVASRLLSWYQAATFSGSTSEKRKTARDRVAELTAAKDVLRAGRDRPERAAGHSPAALIRARAARAKGPGAEALIELATEIEAL